MCYLNPLRKHELSVENGENLWGYRVVIPTSLRDNLLHEWHSMHEGVVKMKTNVYFWWPSLDSDIENRVNSSKILHANLVSFS